MSSENQSSSVKMPSQIQLSFHQNQNQKKNDLSKKIRKIMQQKNKKKKKNNNDYLLKKKLEKKKRRDETCDCADKTDRYPGNIFSCSRCDTSDSDDLDFEGYVDMDTDDECVVDCANAAVKEFNRLHPDRCVDLFKIVHAGHPTCMEIMYQLRIKVQEIKKSDESKHLRAFTLRATVCPITFMVDLLKELP